MYKEAVCGTNKASFISIQKTTSKNVCDKLGTSKMAILHPSSEISPTPERKRHKHLKNSHKNESPFIKTKSSLKQILRIVIFAVSLYTVFELYTFYQRFYCINDINIEQLKRDLKQEVFSQDFAVNTVINSIEELKLQKKTKTLVFVGSNGVGKTFISELVASRFPVHSIQKIHHPEQLHHTTTNSNSCCNLIIVDNLRSRHISDLISFLNSVQATTSCNLIITIFNIQETEDISAPKIDFEGLNLVQKAFQESSLEYRIVLFNMIKQSVIDTWLLNELEKRNVDKSEYNRIIQFVIEDFDSAHVGFKGVNEKLKLAVKMFDFKEEL